MTNLGNLFQMLVFFFQGKLENVGDFWDIEDDRLFNFFSKDADGIHLVIDDSDLEWLSSKNITIEECAEILGISRISLQKSGSIDFFVGKYHQEYEEVIEKGLIHDTEFSHHHMGKGVYVVDANNEDAIHFQKIILTDDDYMEKFVVLVTGSYTGEYRVPLVTRTGFDKDYICIPEDIPASQLKIKRVDPLALPWRPGDENIYEDILEYRDIIIYED